MFRRCRLFLLNTPSLLPKKYHWFEGFKVIFIEQLRWFLAPLTDSRHHRLKSLVFLLKLFGIRWCVCHIAPSDTNESSCLVCCKGSVGLCMLCCSPCVLQTGHFFHGNCVTPFSGFLCLVLLKSTSMHSNNPVIVQPWH